MYTDTVCGQICRLMYYAVVCKCKRVGETQGGECVCLCGGERERERERERGRAGECVREKVKPCKEKEEGGMKRGRQSVNERMLDLVENRNDKT